MAIGYRNSEKRSLFWKAPSLAQHKNLHPAVSHTVSLVFPASGLASSSTAILSHSTPCNGWKILGDLTNDTLYWWQTGQICHIGFLSLSFLRRVTGGEGVEIKNQLPLLMISAPSLTWELGWKVGTVASLLSILQISRFRSTFWLSYKMQSNSNS